MKKIFDKISEGISWLVFAEWYKGGDLGDGILVSILSGAVFIIGGTIALIYCIYSLIY